jgi:chromosome segregation ATPase
LAIFKSCQRSAETLKLGAEGSAAELATLRESAAAAEEEMKRARSALRAAAAGLKRLGSNTARDESKLGGVMDELRSLPSKQAVGLRSEMAGTAAELSKVRGGVDSALRRIFRSGVDI